MPLPLTCDDHSAEHPRHLVELPIRLSTIHIRTGNKVLESLFD